jgi:hypothetical protein
LLDLQDWIKRSGYALFLGNHNTEPRKKLVEAFDRLGVGTRLMISMHLCH